MKVKKATKKFLKYYLTMSLQWISDLFLLWFFTEFMGLYYLYSATIAVIFSSIIGYSTSKRYVFTKSKRSFLEGYGFFLLVTLFKILAIVGLLYFFVDICGVHYMLARIIIIPLLTIIIYTLHTKLTFRTNFD